jgi:hypothetical protein
MSQVCVYDQREPEESMEGQRDERFYKASWGGMRTLDADLWETFDDHLVGITSPMLGTVRNALRIRAADLVQEIMGPSPYLTRRNAVDYDAIKRSFRADRCMQNAIDAVVAGYTAQRASLLEDKTTTEELAISRAFSKPLTAELPLRAQIVSQPAEALRR